MGLLSFYEGYIFQKIFGERIICLRILTQLNMLASISIVSWYYWRKTHNYQITALSLVTCALLCRICAELLYDWNTAAYPFLVLGAIAMLEYLSCSKLKNTLFLGVALALMTLAKFTLIVSLPGAIIFLFIANKFNKGIKDSSILILAFIVTMLVGYLIILGSPINWIDCWSPNNIITGHDNLILIVRPFKSIPRLLVEGVPLLVAFFFSQNISCLRTRLHTSIAFALSLILLFALNFSIVRMVLWFMMADRPLVGYSSMAVGFIFVLTIFHNRFDKIKIIKIVSIFAFTIVIGFGSDVMFYRPIWFLTLPLVLIYSQIDNRTLKLWLSLSILTSMSYFAYTINNYTRANTSSHNDYPRIAGMMETPEHSAWLSELLTDINDNVPDINDATVAGQGKYLVNYLLTDGAGYQNNFFHYIDHSETEHVNPRMLQDMSTHNYVILIGPTWQDFTKYVLNQKAIKDAGFEEVLAKPTYVLYKRK